MKRHILLLLNLLVITAMLATTLLASAALDAPVSSPGTMTNTPIEKGMAFSVERLEIRFQRLVFDPLSQTPDLPEGLSLNAYPGDGTGYYLVQFKGPILPDWKKTLQEQGAIVLDYVPQFAFIVRMNSAISTRVKLLDAVRWVGLYQPAFRLSTDLDKVIAGEKPDQMTRVVVRSFTGEPPDVLLKQLEASGAKVQAMGSESGGGVLFKLELPATSLPDVARLSGVAWVEPWAQPILHNAIARSDLGMNKNGVETRLGLYGAGQIVVDGDTGVSTGNTATMHDDFKGHFYKGSWGSGICGSWADYDEHGTHTAGSVLGNGVRSGAITATHAYSGSNAGIAPEALLWAWAFCDNWSGLPDTNPYTDYFTVMYNDDPRARINTNSWGYDAPAGTYNAFSREVDRFIWDHQDMSVFFSAGNDGTDANSDGIVDSGSMGVPAGAKNVVTVGASENYRMTGGYNPGSGCSTWGGCWASDYPANPVKNDRLSDDPMGMAAFSSRGPTLDGRLKPDVVAPGSNIVSTRYQGTATGWGVYDAYYLYMGGTSMATPLTAGGGAVVREYYSVTRGITNPTAALVKATLINGARDMTPGQYRDTVPDGSKDDVIRRPDINQGWGRVDLYNSLVHDAPNQLWFHEHLTGLTTTQEYVQQFTVSDNQHPVRVTLAWSDYPGTEAANGGLVSDLDLTVTAPDGVTYNGNDLIGDGLLDGDVDHVNNVEGLDFTQIGNYTVRVRAYNTPQGPQPFALVVSGDMGGYIGTLAGTVSESGTGTSLPGASLYATASPTMTNNTTSGPGGAYSMALVAGTYTLTVTQYGYMPATISGLSIVSGTTTTQNVALTIAPTYVISGVVTDSVTGAPLWATVNVAGNPFNPPTTSVQTNPATGYYSLTVAGGQSYTLTVSALFHTAQVSGLGVPVSNRTENFALVATTTNGGIVGWVRNYYTSQPIENAVVTVQATGTPSDTSDAQGYFEILGLAAGVYTSTATAPLYSPATINNIQVPQSNLAIVTFSLPSSHINYAPPSLQKSVTLGTVVTDAAGLVITDTGLGSLTYELMEWQGGFTPTLRHTDSGGPDPYGYTWSTSAEAGGPAYAWIDATGGTALGLSDDSEANITSPFAFPFYGSTSTALRVGNNGGVLYNATTGEVEFGNIAITNTSTSNNFIAPFWDDIDDETGNVYWMVTGSAPNRKLVVEWYSRPHYQLGGGVGSATFEVVLFEDGDILYQYLDVNFGNASYDNGASATVGIRGANATNSLQYSYNTASLQDNYAICFDNPTSLSRCGTSADPLPWLTESPISGTLAGGVTTTQNIQLVWDASVPEVTQPGAYTGSLKIISNDPLAQNTFVPVTMTVLPPTVQGKLMGSVSSSGYCDVNPQPISATIRIDGGGGYSKTLQADATGTYSWWLDPAQNPYSVTASYAGNPTTTVPISITSGMTTTQNFDLRLLAPCVSVMPSELTNAQPSDVQMTRTLTVNNTGASGATWSITETIAWLSALPVSGTVSGDSSIAAVMTFNSTGLPTGVYTGSLSVNTSDSGQPSVLIPVTMTVGAPPACSFASSSPDDLGQTTVFTNTTTGSPDPIYRWNWGDGSALDTAVCPTHPYAHTGVYTVILTATNTWGEDVCTGTASIEGLEPGFTSNSPVVLGNPVVFTNTTLANPPVFGWVWDLGDSNSSAALIPPPHTYSNAGVYTVTMTAINTKGSSTYTSTVAVMFHIYLPIIRR